jgi:AcrR family transcriptional regulator
MEIHAVRPQGRERRGLGTANPEVRRRLLKAAVKIIREQGFPALRIEDLVREAGFSVGTFYLYFNGKADLFVNLTVEHTQWLRGRLRASYQGEGTTLERLARALDVYLDFVTEAEAGFLHFLESGHVQTTAGPLSAWAMAQHAADLRPVLEEGMRRGELRQEDPELLAHAVIALNQSVAGFWLQHKDTHARQRIKQFILTFVTSGLAPPP